MNLNKIRQLLLSISIVFGITFMFQYFFNTSQNVLPTALESGRSRLAPKKEEDQRPLNLEINFCTDKSIEEHISTIKTDHAKFEFTTYGGAIKSSEFKHLTSKKHIFKTFEAQGKEDLGFLVAFEENTPFYYNLVDQTENSEMFTIVYSADFENGIIYKKYSIFKNEYKLDLTIDVKFKADVKDPLRLRLFYPSPNLPEVKEDVIQGICNEKNAVVKKGMNLLLQRYWEIPLIFGTENKYFVHSMVNDLNKFTQRGYYKSVGIGKFSSILESSLIQKSESFNLSFYLGPKQSAAMDIVEPKLESILDYGYLAPFSKLMLAVLVFFYTFFHNYGIAIILLTLLIKLILLPFTLKGEQSMKKRAEFQKKLQYVQNKYRHDKDALAHARSELMRENGFSDMIGCLPLLLQLPIGIALNRVLFNAIELYRAPFLWMSDLSAKDPYYILPLLIGVAMIMNPAAAGNDPKQRFSTYAVALVVTAFTAGLPAGLMLFIFMSIFSSVVQSKIYLLFKKS